jgi:hypothetical protein
MTDALARFLLTWLLWWAVIWCAYSALLFGMDWLIAVWRRHRRQRQHLRAHYAELQRIDEQTAVAVCRIGAAFAVAQYMIRDQQYER